MVALRNMSRSYTFRSSWSIPSTASFDFLPAFFLTSSFTPFAVDEGSEYDDLSNAAGDGLVSGPFGLSFVPSLAISHFATRWACSSSLQGLRRK